MWMRWLRVEATIDRNLSHQMYKGGGSTVIQFKHYLLPYPPQSYVPTEKPVIYYPLINRHKNDTSCKAFHYTRHLNLYHL